MNDVDDFRNGRRSFPEIDRLMRKLIAYDESDYHAPDAQQPRMVPLRKWVKSENEMGLPIFPGACGVYGPKLMRSAIMVLLQDYDVLDRYRIAVKFGYSKTGDGTATTLERFLKEAGVDLNRCFFTNRFMGVRDAPDQYGPNPGWCSARSPRQYAPYMQMCNEMLAAQLDELQPKLIFTFGRFVPDSLGFGTLWQDKLIREATVMGHAVTVAALVHPSLRNVNVAKVKYGNLQAHAAELQIVQDALFAARL